MTRKGAQSMQLDLFPALEPILVCLPCAPDGHVCKQSEILETIHLRDKKVEIRIELARDGDRWMFSTSVQTGTSYYGYRVGKKWGKFTNSREDALHFSFAEVKERSPRQAVPQLEKLLASFDPMAGRLTA